MQPCMGQIASLKINTFYQSATTYPKQQQNHNNQRQHQQKAWENVWITLSQVGHKTGIIYTFPLHAVQHQLF